MNAPATRRRASAGAEQPQEPQEPQDPRDEIALHLKPMRLFALSLTRDLSRADDLVQDTVVKAWTNIDKFQPGTNMRAWLFTILRNTFYSERRRAKREVSDVDGMLAGRIATKPDHDGRLALNDFRAAFEQLPDEQREVLILVGAQGFSYEDAAETCGCAVGTVKSRANRGRRRLAELLGMDATETMELTDQRTLAVIAENPRSG
ncbi:MAG: RNA polymerase sigma factor [Rhodosalinus sp.]|uniref:RNA polymerase sigma factor n=1 Tax=Rhodosalinus sp. TaxID=2047741 RepID=UPI00397AD1EC